MLCGYLQITKCPVITLLLLALYLSSYYILHRTSAYLIPVIVSNFKISVCLFVSLLSTSADASWLKVCHEWEVLITALWIIGLWHSSQSISGLRTNDYNCSLSLRDGLARPAFSQRGDTKTETKTPGGQVTRRVTYTSCWHRCGRKTMELSAVLENKTEIKLEKGVRRRLEICYRGFRYCRGS